MGDKVTLRRGFEYVNLRPEPAYGAGVPDIGDFCGGAAVEVLEQRGEMVAIKVWVHGGYLERLEEEPQQANPIPQPQPRGG